MHNLSQLSFNPLMPKRYFSISIYFIDFKTQMLQGANTDVLTH